MDHSSAVAIVLDLMCIWDDDKKSSKHIGIFWKGDRPAFSLQRRYFKHPLVLSLGHHVGGESSFDFWVPFA